MKKYIKRLLQSFVSRFVSDQNSERIIRFLAHVKNVDIIHIAHQSIGIMKYLTPEESGEAYIINTVIAKYFDYRNGRRPVIFDIGANVGNYTCQLAHIHPNIDIFSFEPNPSTYTKLSANIAAFKNAQGFNLGLGSEKGFLNMYTYADDLESEHASVYRDVLSELHSSNALVEKQVVIETIYDFCKGNRIEKIDFLKIDTEGFEYEVLKGAKDMLVNNRIPLIQFEFNEMNVVSRVFLKDFYEILSDYDLFRIDSNRLIPLGGYNSRNEIFQFQNILAIYR
jgi:FkbM family methyltransferase